MGTYEFTKDCKDPEPTKEDMIEEARYYGAHRSANYIQSQADKLEKVYDLLRDHCVCGIRGDCNFCQILKKIDE